GDHLVPRLADTAPDAASPLAYHWPVLLAYVDESYIAKRFFCLGALLVDDESACWIEEGLDALVDEYASKTALPASAELHGHELFQGKGDWEHLAMRQQINVYDRALRI